MALSWKSWVSWGRRQRSVLRQYSRPSEELNLVSPPSQDAGVDICAQCCNALPNLDVTVLLCFICAFPKEYVPQSLHVTGVRFLAEMLHYGKRAVIRCRLLEDAVPT